MRKKKATKTQVISFKITKELSDRVDECADRTKQSRASIAEQALEAAVDAIEANDYKLVVPIRFDVSHVPVTVRQEERKDKRA